MRAAPLLLALVSVCAPRAETLPIRVYTTDDGLPRNQVGKIVEDREGFLWMLTPSGPSRFDGISFVDPGWDVGVIDDLRDDPGGVVWLAGRRGVFRADPEPRRCEMPAELDRTWFTALGRDAGGTLWAGALGGLHAVEERGGACAVREGPAALRGALVRQIVAEPSGTLWVATGQGLYRRTDTRWERVPGLPSDDVRAFALGDGEAWIATRGGLARLADGKVDTVSREIDLWDVLVDGATVWAASFNAGLLRVERPADGTWTVASLGPAQGLSDRAISCLAKDAAGNLWIGTESGGAMRLLSGGFTSYGTADGLSDRRVVALLETREGDMVALAGHVQRALNRFDGSRFAALRPNVGTRDPGWGTHQLDLQARDGTWWIPTGQGLLRFPAVPLRDLPRVAPLAVYGPADGLDPDQVFRLYEDRTGDLWIATTVPGRNLLYRRRGATGRFEPYGTSAGLPDEPVTAFAEDSRGHLWLGLYASGLGRMRDGRVQRFGPGEGGPAGIVMQILFDRAGRLWAASGAEGLVRCEDPGAERPRFTRVRASDGLSSDVVRCVVEDGQGRIWAGTALGVDRLDPATGAIRRFSVADGLARGENLVGLRDRDGNLWFGAHQGLSRIRPGADPPRRSPGVRITSVRVAGSDSRVPALGTRDVPEIVVAPDQRELEIGFAGLDTSAGTRLRYQFLLEGAATGWSAPSTERRIHLAGLSPGRYRFLVRAVDPEGGTSAVPATVALRVLPPLWRRSWFLGGLASFAALGLYGVHRVRVRRLLEMERLRTRIAMDLHDEVGSGLGSIAMLAGVAAEGEIAEDRRRGLARDVAETAAHLGAALADIVWSLRERSGTLDALAVHLAERGHRLFPADTPTFRVDYPASFPEVPVSLAVRRTVPRIAAEAMHNAAKHAQAGTVTLTLAQDGPRWSMAVHDDGRGFDELARSARAAGLGLTSMRRRAEDIGASFVLDSAPGRGTTVTVVFDPGAGDLA